MDTSHSTRTFRNGLLLATIVAAATLAVSPTAMAQTSIWTTAGNGNWDNAANWDTAFFPNAIDADAVFNGTNPAADSTITLAATDITVGTIQINNPTTSLITGRTITFNDPTSAQIQFNDGNWTIASDIVLDSDLTLTGAAGGTISGVIADGAASGLTKTGAGVVHLNAANTLTGPVNVTGGILVLNNGSGSGGTLNNISQLTLSNHGMVRLGATGTIGNTAAVNLGGSSVFDLDGFTETIGSLLGSSGTSVTIDGGLLEIAGSASTTFSGAISGAGTLLKSGSSTLTLGGVNPFTGDTSVTDGVLRLAATNVFGSTSGIAVSGDGVLQLAASNAINDATGVTLSNTAVFDLDGNTEAIATLNGSANTSVTLGNGHLQVIDNANSTFSGVMSGDGSFQKSGTKTMILGNANTFTGSTQVDDGVLQLDAVDALGSTSDITLNGTAVLRQNVAGSAINNMAAITLNDTAVFDLGGNDEAIGSLSGAAGSFVTLGAGTLQTGLNDASTTYSGVISGTGGLTKSGVGTFTLDGANTYTGPTTIAGGRLDVNGSVASAVTALSGATLGGVGSVESAVINGGATVAPGNSIGTLTVAGSGTPAFTQLAGSTYQVEVDNAGAVSGDAAAPVTTPGVNNDLIDLTSAVSTVSLAGTVDVQDTTGGGFYDAGTTYTILRTANPNGVTGQAYDSVTDNIFLRDAVLQYTDDSVQVQLRRIDGNFAASAATPNQRHVGTVLDTVNPLATGDLGVVLDQMVQLTSAQKPAVLDQLSGEIHAAAAGNVVQTTSRFNEMVSRRLRANSSGPIGQYGTTVNAGTPMMLGSNSGPMQRIGLTGGGDFVVRAQGLNVPSYGQAYGPCDTMPCPVAAAPSLGGIWATGYGLSANVDGNGNGNPFDYNSYGTAFGIEQSITEALMMGIVGGYSRSNVDMSRPHSSADVDSYHVGLYGHLTEGIVYSSAVVTYGIQQYDTSRQINIPGPMPINRSANASYSGQEFNVYGEKGVNMSFGGLRIQPLIGVQYIDLQRDAFRESGAGSLNLNVNQDHVNSLRGSVGGRIAPELPDGYFGAIIPEIRGRYIHEFLNDNQAISSNFAGAPGANFIVNSADLGRNFGLVGAGLKAQISPLVNLYVDYDFLFSSALQSHSGSGGLEFTW